jgi:hypothetical protein
LIRNQGSEATGSGFRFPAYFRQQAAALWQQDDPLQHPAFADFAKELPNVNITRAARLRTLIVSFFI